jgi:hypothetical protein
MTPRSYFFRILCERNLVSLFDFENREALFPGVHRSYKFSLVTLSGREQPEAPSFAFFCLGPQDLHDPDRQFVLSAEDIALVNPDTLTCPVFRSRVDAELTKRIYKHGTVLAAGEAAGGWGVAYLLKLIDPTIHREMLRGDN